jgi:hypothetical protein
MVPGQVLDICINLSKTTNSGVVRQEGGQIRGSAIDRQQRPSPLVSLVLLGLRAGVHSNLAHNMHDNMIMRAIDFLRTSENAVKSMLRPAIRPREPDGRQ